MRFRPQTCLLRRKIPGTTKLIRAFPRQGISTGKAAKDEPQSNLSPILQILERQVDLLSIKDLKAQDGELAAAEGWSRFKLPGLNLPLNWTPGSPYGGPCSGEGRPLFPTALSGYDICDGWASWVSPRFPGIHTDAKIDHNGHVNLLRLGGADAWNRLPLLTLREITMLQIINQLTDKPDWDKKVGLESPGSSLSWFQPACWHCV